jgi:hypothetical protein
MILMLVLTAISFIASPALIDSVNNIARGGKYRFWDSFSHGVDFFWRMFGYTMVGIGAAILIAIVVGIFAIILTPFSLLLTIPLAFTAFISLTAILGLGKRAMVVRDSSLADSINEGYFLFRSRLSDVVVGVLINAGFFIAVSIGIMIVSLVVFGPINSAVRAILEGDSVIMIGGMLLSLPITIVVGGFCGVFFSSFWTLFYFELVEPGGQSQSLEPDAPDKPAPPSNDDNDPYDKI